MQIAVARRDVSGIRKERGGRVGGEQSWVGAGGEGQAGAKVQAMAMLFKIVFFFLFLFPLCS